MITARPDLPLRATQREQSRHLLAGRPDDLMASNFVPVPVVGLTRWNAAITRDLYRRIRSS